MFFGLQSGRLRHLLDDRYPNEAVTAVLPSSGKAVHLTCCKLHADQKVFFIRAGLCAQMYTYYATPREQEHRRGFFLKKARQYRHKDTEIELLLQQRALTTRKISVSILSQNIGDQFYIYFCDNLLFTQRVVNFICIKIMKS